MNLTIHTYGHIDAMFYILNGMAMLIQHQLGQTLIVTAGLLSGAYYAMRIAYAGNANYQAFVAKVIGMFAMMTLLLTPNTSMTIYDHVSKKYEKVDNLPIGFALPIGALENFGDLLTEGFEQAFSVVLNGGDVTPAQISYRHYGLLFGARLVQESRNWRIKSPEFVENMQNFIDRCVMIEAMIGYYYTPEDLITSPDVWQLVANNAGELRKLSVRVGKRREIMSCQQVAKEILEPAFVNEVLRIEDQYANSIFNLAGATNYIGGQFYRASRQFKANLQAAFSQQIGAEVSAEQLMRQQMLVHAMREYGDQYAFVRASMTQESNWKIAGELASTYLPILLTVLKGLVYSSFVFMLPLLVLSGGWQRYLSYLVLVASLQLWAPLNAVLNMFIDLYTTSTLPDLADRIVSFSSVQRIGEFTDKIVTVASGLQMSIPFLSFSLMQGGVNGFIHLAGNITGASQAAAGSVANEVVTGNKSFDNHYFGNQQLYQQGGFKTDWNQAYASGGSQYQHLDGSMERVTAGGNTLMQSGVGLSASSGATQYHLEESRQGQVMAGIQKQEALVDSTQHALSEAERNTFSSTARRIASIAEREHRGESFNYDELGEQGKAMQQAVNVAKQLSDKSGVSFEQAANAALSASAKYGTPLASIVGSEASFSASGEISLGMSSSQIHGNDLILNKEDNSNENYHNLVKAAANTSWAKDLSSEQNFAQEAHNEYAKQINLEQQLAKRQESLKNWHQAKSIIETQGASSSRDMYQEVVDQIKNDYGVGAMSAQQMADKRSVEAQTAWKKLQQQDSYVQNLVADINHGKTQVSGAVATQQMQEFNNQQQHHIEREVNRNVKSDNGDNFDANTIKQQITGTQDQLKDEFKNINLQNARQFIEVKEKNENVVRQMQKSIEPDTIANLIQYGDVNVTPQELQLLLKLQQKKD